MKKTRVYGVVVGMVVATGMCVGSANANNFLPGSSSGTITHTPDLNDPTLQDADASPTFPAVTNITPVPGAPVPVASHNTTFTSGASTSQGIGGIGRFDTFGLYGASGFANVSFSYGAGVGQTDGSSVFGGASELRMAVDMTWDISDGWSGPRVAYELMSVNLNTAGPGDVASVTGDFTFAIDMNANSSAGNDIVRSVHVARSVQDGNDLSTTLFASTLLTTSSLAAAPDGDAHLLNITGEWVFTALDPSGEAGVTLQSFFETADLINRLQAVAQVDDQFSFEAAQAFALDFQNNPGMERIATHGGGTFALIIPEPASMSLLVIGLGGLAMRRRPQH